MLRLFGCFLFLLIVLPCSSQKKRSISKAVKFGDVTAADFSPASYSIDSNANAVILYDIGISEFDNGKEGDFTLTLRCHRRIRILNKNAFDLATVKIPLRDDENDHEELEEFEAVTYNLVDGKVLRSKLDKNTVYYDKQDKYFRVARFTFENIKEGSIIEFRYKINSPYYRQLRPWIFQDQYPVLWSEYSVVIPSVFQYMSFRKHYFPYHIEESNSEFRNYYVKYQTNGLGSSMSYNIGAVVTRFHWVIRDLPAFKDEDHLFSESNYIEKIEFIQDGLAYPDQPVIKLIESWPKLSEMLMADEDFGATLSNNSWLKADLALILKGIDSDIEKAQRIYVFVRDNFKCTDDEARELSQPLKTTFRERKGNVADINLLLTSMLLSQGLKAKPVLLSTRSNGFPTEGYPSIRKFNYVICILQIDDKSFLLDASKDRLGFNRLSLSCYNGAARVIDSACSLLRLSPDSIKEQMHTSVFITNRTDGSMNALVQSDLGYFESYDLRRKILSSGSEELFKAIKDAYTYPVEMSKTEIDSLRRYEDPITLRYELRLGIGNEDMIYFNPMLSEAYRKNPFVSDKRLYPVEMPSLLSELYTLNMEVPKGYKVEELPKSTKVKLNDNEGLFEYIIRDNGDGTISLRCRIELYKALFDAEDYDQLRAFFGHIVMKEAEPIVFKRTGKGG